MLPAFEGATELFFAPPTRPMDFPHVITPLDARGFPFLVFWPEAIDRTKLDIVWFAPDWGEGELPHADVWQQRLAVFDVVMSEDYANLEPIQRSMENAAHGGQVVNYQERRIWHVHTWIDKMIGPERIPPEPAGGRPPGRLDGPPVGGLAEALDRWWTGLNSRTVVQRSRRHGDNRSGDLRLPRSRCLAHFWAGLLGYQLDPPPPGYDSWEAWLTEHGIPESEWNSASAVSDPEGRGPRIYFQRVPEPKELKNRVHLDVNAGGPRGTPDEERRAAVDAAVERGRRPGGDEGAAGRRAGRAPLSSCRIPKATSSACSSQGIPPGRRWPAPCSRPVSDWRAAGEGGFRQVEVVAPVVVAPVVAGVVPAIVVVVGSWCSSSWSWSRWS